MWALFLLIALSNFPPTSLQVPREFITGLQSKDIIIKCAAELLAAYDGVKISKGFTSVYEYLSVDEKESLPLGLGKYEVQRNGKTFKFTIKSATFEDADIYRCEYMPSGPTIAEYSVVLTTAPKLRLIGTHMAGDFQKLVCYTNVIVPDIDGSICTQKGNKCPFLHIQHKQRNNSTSSYIISDKQQNMSRISYKMKTNIQYKALEEYNGTLGHCALFDRETLVANVTKPMIIKYPVTIPSISPQRRQFKPGEMLVCEARGNPPPLIIWKQEGSDKAIQCRELYLTADMMGKNTWSCIAENEPEFKLIVKESRVSFDVREENDQYMAHYHSTNTAVIVLAILTTLTLMIILLIPILMIIRKRRQGGPRYALAAEGMHGDL